MSVMSSDYESDTWTVYTEPDPETDSEPGANVEQVNPLNVTEVHNLRKVHGLNKVKTEDRITTWYTVLRASCHPINLILILLATTCFILKTYEFFVAVTLVVLIATALRTHQMKNTTMASVNMLRFATAKKVTALRFDMFQRKITEEKLPATELVPGDYIRLYPGDLIPADVEIVKGKNFEVLEYNFDGENSSVRTYPNDVGATRERKGIRESIAGITSSLETFFPGVHMANSRHVELNNDPEFGDMELADLKKRRICFMGSGVIAGTALCRVVFTGADTYLGKKVNEVFHKNHTRPKGFLSMVYVAVGIVFVIEVLMIIPLAILSIYSEGGYSGLAFILALGIVIFPKFVATMVSATLAKASLKMKLNNCILKDVSTLMKLAEIDILCVGKTGILTMDDIFLRRTVNCDGVSSYDPLFLAYLNAYFPPVKTSPLDSSIEKFFKEAVAKTCPGIPSPKMPPSSSLHKSPTAFRASTAEACDNDNNMGNTDGKLQETLSFTEKLRLVAELPFDFVRRRVSVIIEETMKKSPDVFLICKGAAQEVLEQCTTVMPYRNPSSESEVHLNNLFYIYFKSRFEALELKRDHKQELQRIVEKLVNEGLLVIGVAYKKITTEPSSKCSTLPMTFTIDDEKDLTFIGFLGFVDPTKYDARGPIKSLVEKNVLIKLLAGDVPQPCLKIATSLGIHADKAFTGQDFSIMGIPRDILSKMLKETNVFAKLAPIHKAEIVKTLQKKGHKVGFIGTSIADLPALAEAHLGISIFGGTSICTLSSDLIIPCSDLTYILNGIIAGRKTYGKVLKYLIITLSSSLAFITSLLSASLWLPFYPITSLQALVFTVICDTAQISILWDEVLEDFLKSPHRLSIKFMLEYIFSLGFLQCGFNASTHLFMFFYLGVKTPQDNVPLFQTASFVSILVMQAFTRNVLLIWKLPFPHSFTGTSWIMMTLPLTMAGVFLPFTPEVNKFLGLEYLPLQFYVYLVFALIITKFLANLLVKFNS